MKKDIKYIAIIIVFASIFFIGNNKLYIGDDCDFHTTNIIANANTNSLLPSKILPLIEENVGYGVNIFYPPLPHLTGSYIYRLTKNIELTMQILEYLSIFLAGLTMYLYIEKTFNNKEQALLASILYMSMPYLFTDVFTRTALNESFLFYQLPIIFLSFHYLTEEKYNKFYICFILGFTLAIYNHLVLTIYIALFSIIYLLIHYKEVLKKEKIIKLIKASIIVLGLTMPFWGLLIEHYILKDYYIFTVKYQLGTNFHTYPTFRYLFPNEFYSDAKNQLKFYITPISFIFLECTYILLWQNKIKNNHKKKLISLLIILIINILLVSNTILWNIIPNLFKNIQFPWRLSMLIAFTTTVMASYGIRLWNKKIIIASTIIVLMIINYMSSSKLTTIKREKELLNTNVTNNYNWQKEYLPISTTYNIYSIVSKNEKFKQNKNIKIVKNNVPNLKFKVNNLDKNITLEFPRIYYLGYELRDKDNKKVKLNKSINGLLEAKIKKNGIYHLTYKGTLISKISYIIAIISLIIYIKLIIKDKNMSIKENKCKKR